MSEDEFYNMAASIIKTNSMFTGAEIGRSLLKKLTTEQLDTLINHKWPDSKTLEENSANSLESIIRNIKFGNKFEAQSQEKQKLATNNENLVSMDHNGGKNSKEFRVKKVISIGKKMRNEGMNFVDICEELIMCQYMCSA